MHQLLSARSNCVKTLAVCILVCFKSVCLADEKEDLAATNAIIAIVESGQPEQAKDAAELFKSIPANSKAKPVAAHALALVYIREHQYSDAWKAVTSQWEQQSVASDAIKLGKEKMKLWLLLEAGAADKAQDQLKRLVAMTIDADAAAIEQTANCGFIGGVVGMLNTDASSSCIPQTILEEQKNLLVMKVEAKTAKSELEAKLMEANRWGSELSLLVSKFDSVGASKADEQNKSTQTEYEQSKKEQSKLRDDVKEAGGGKQELEVQRRARIKEQRAVWDNLQREKKNQPAQPVNPGPQPRQPSKPDGSYKTDPRTQERKYVEPPAKEMREYERELALYKTWPTRFAQYKSDSAQYQGKLQAWQQNVAALEAHAQAADEKVAAIVRAIREMQDGIKQGVGKELKEAGEEAKRLERFAAISNLAYSHIASDKAKAKSPFHPSNFQLIDYDSECSRMRRALR